jgi:hypothetical protein
MSAAPTATATSNARQGAQRPASGGSAAVRESRELAGADGLDQRQLHRWAGWMLAITASTCMPQPVQVTFPQR